MHHTIIGIVIASTLLIIPTEYPNWWSLVISVVCFAAGFAASVFMNKLDKNSEKTA